MRTFLSHFNLVEGIIWQERMKERERERASELEKVWRILIAVEGNGFSLPGGTYHVVNFY